MAPSFGAKEGGIRSYPPFSRTTSRWQQPEKETWDSFGIEMAFETLMAEEAVQDCYVIIRNDCAPALSCLERGS